MRRFAESFRIRVSDSMVNRAVAAGLVLGGLLVVHGKTDDLDGIDSNPRTWGEVARGYQLPSSEMEEDVGAAIIGASLILGSLYYVKRGREDYDNLVREISEYEESSAKS